MNYKTLSEYVKKYNLEKYISLFRCYTLYDNEYSMFYLEKNKILWRLMNGFSRKYIVFQNYDLEYGKRKKTMIFSNIDDASNYLWNIFVDYIYESKNEELLKIIKQ